MNYEATPKEVALLILLSFLCGVMLTLALVFAR